MKPIIGFLGDNTLEVSQTSLTFPIPDEPLVQLEATVPIDSFFPEKEANRLAEIESFNKHLFRPNTYLHKWWARRSGSTFRYILKQLVPDFSKRDYYLPGGLEGVTILDPMMGGGTILHEAIRLGSNVIGYDIDPIPVLQAKASFSSIPVSDKIYVYNFLQKELSKRFCNYYKTTCPICNGSAEIQFTLYGLRKMTSDGEVLAVDSFILREESDDTQIRLEEFYPLREVCQNGQSWPIIDKDDARKQEINAKSADILSVPFTKRYVPIIIVGYCHIHHTFFKKIAEADLKLISLAARWVKKNTQYSSSDFEIPHGPKSDDLINRNIHYFSELFFPRQLAYIAHFQAVLSTVSQEHKLWLALLLSTSLEFNSALCGYKGAEKRRPGAIRHVFSHHAYSFPYTALENNPMFSRDTSGTLGSLFKSRIVSAGEWAREPIERRFVNKLWIKTTIQNEVDIGEGVSSLTEFLGNHRKFLVAQNDSTQMPLPSGSVDFIVTDPPYFDSVQYSDLSHFFRCWLKTLLPEQANWQYLAQHSAVAETIENEDKFCCVIGRIWKECNRLLARPHGRLIFTYHHWKASAWAKLTIALHQADFVLTNAFVLHSENPISVHIKNLHSLKHDTILILKPRKIGFPIFWHKPKPIIDFDSYSFCQACGQMTGWILQTTLPESQIEQEWTTFLKG